ALALDERLRRGADQREAVQLEQEQVRRRVDAAERTVEVERRRGRGPRRALREHDLECIARADVVLRGAYRALILGAARCALRETAPAVPGGQLRGRACEEARDLVRVAADHLCGVLDMVEADEDVGGQETALGEVVTLNGYLVRQLLY